MIPDEFPLRRIDEAHVEYLAELNLAGRLDSADKVNPAVNQQKHVTVDRLRDVSDSADDRSFPFVVLCC